ncbi:MAG: NHLP leader peptide family RiPP precursor [Bacteroidota bacterium]
METTEAQKILAGIIQEAWKDARFKKALMEKPKATIEAFTGRTLQIPDGKTLVVCDQTDRQMLYLNIPPQTSLDDMELNEEQLEIIAGGNDAIISDPTAAFAALF